MISGILIFFSALALVIAVAVGASAITYSMKEFFSNDGSD